MWWIHATIAVRWISMGAFHRSPIGCKVERNWYHPEPDGRKFHRVLVTRIWRVRIDYHEARVTNPGTNIIEPLLEDNPKAPERTIVAETYIRTSVLPERFDVNDYIGPRLIPGNPFTLTRTPTLLGPSYGNFRTDARGIPGLFRTQVVFAVTPWKRLDWSEIDSRGHNLGTRVWTTTLLPNYYRFGLLRLESKHWVRCPKHVNK